MRVVLATKERRERKEWSKTAPQRILIICIPCFFPRCQNECGALLAVGSNDL